MIRRGLLRPLHTFTTYCSILMLISSCIGNNDVSIKLKNPKKKENAATLPPVTVSNVQVVNHQIVITGTNLASVSQFKIKEGSTNTTLQIESKTSTTIVANTLSNVTFAAGKILDFILSNAEAASTFTVNFSLCDSTLGGKTFNCTLTPNDKEVLSYDAVSGKWQPRAVNGLSYIGTFDASGGGNPAAKPAGQYYIVSVAGDIDAGATILGVGDWIVSNGTGWQKIDNSTVITSVHGRTGAVLGAEGDYTLNQLDDVAIAAPINNQILKYNGTTWVNSDLSALGGGTVTSVSGTAPIAVANGTSTPAISIAQANTTTSGYLTNTDWNTFNNKQPAIAAGTTAQYYRGDKTWQTLDTSIVPENTNLYFSNARALGVPLTGFVANNATIAATDTIVQAFGKAQGQIDNLTAGGSNYIVKNGNDTVTGVVNFNTVGALSIGYTPTNLTDATSKSYVDAQRDSRVAKAGDTMSGDLQLNTALKFKDSGSNTASIQAPTTIPTSYVLKLPPALGSNNQVLTTDATGNLSWTTPATSAAPSGAAGGELAGTYPNPTIAANAITDSHIAANAISQSKINGLTTALSGKEPTITAAGNTTTYYRGDKSWQTLDTSVVPENTNLYYTNARGIASTITAPTLTNSAIASGDTLQVVAGKLQAQINTNEAADANKLSKNSNDSITATVTVSGAGDIIVPSTPAGMTSAVNKTYVDDRVANASNQWTLSGSDVYRLSGKVGIGTATPLTSLTIQGTGGSNDDVYIDSYGDTGEGALMLRRARTNSTTPTTLLANDRIGFISFRGYNGTAYSDLARVQGIAESDLNTSASAALQFYTTNAGSNTEKMRISAAGNVGIGTTNPQYTLDITGTTRQIGSAAFENNTASGAGPSFSFWKHRNFSSTQVGDDLGFLSFYGSDSGLRRGAYIAGRQEAVSAGSLPTFLLFATATSGNADAVERMRISSAGNVGIGTTSPGTALDVNGAITQSGVVSKTNSYSVPTASTVTINLPHGGNSLVDGHIYKFNLATQNTATTTGASYIVYQTAVGTWASKLVSANGITSNHPLLQLSGTNVQIFHNHAATYSISVLSEAIQTGNISVMSPHYFGLEGAMTNLSGNVGIGTSTPTNMLHINNAAGEEGSPGLFIQDPTASSAYGGSLYYEDRGGANAIKLSALENGTESGYLAVDRSSGRVGINTTSPHTTFHVARDVTDADVTGGLGNITVGGVTSPLKHLMIGYNTQSNYGYLQGNTYGSTWDPIIINPKGGNVGIGIGTPAASLDLFGNSSGAGVGVMRLRNTVNSGGTRYWQIGPDGNGNGNFVVYTDALAGAYIVYGQTTWSSSSDRRLKKEIEPIADGLNKVLQLNGVTYKYKKDKESDPRKAGVIAQDVQKVLPEAVTKQDGFLGVKYTELIGLLIEGIKDFYYQVTNRFASIERSIASKADRSELEVLKAENHAKDLKIRDLEKRLEKIEKAINSK